MTRASCAGKASTHGLAFGPGAQGSNIRAARGAPRQALAHNHHVAVGVGENPTIGDPAHFFYDLSGGFATRWAVAAIMFCHSGPLELPSHRCRRVVLLVKILGGHLPRISAIVEKAFEPTHGVVLARAG